MAKLEVIQWHPAFCSAIELELIENKDDLSYEREHPINTKPIAVDLLVVKLDHNTRIKNEIGRRFLRYNIFEFKSPEDELNIDVLYKVNGYACLYKAYGDSADSIKADEITISLVRKSRPIKLLNTLKSAGHKIDVVGNGIYWVTKGPHCLFPLQIIVTEELNREEHTWLNSLRRDLSEEDVDSLVSEAVKHHGTSEHKLMESVIQVAIRANREIFGKAKEEETMIEALIELMEPELKMARDRGVELGRNAGKAEGLAEGEVKERIKNLSFMLQNGISEETLRKSSLYSEKEIQEALKRATQK